MSESNCAKKAKVGDLVKAYGNNHEEFVVGLLVGVGHKNDLPYEVDGHHCKNAIKIPGVIVEMIRELK